MRTLEQEVMLAGNREQNDDHLSDSERESLVRRYRLAHPEESLNEDWREAYIQIVLG